MVDKACQEIDQKASKKKEAYKKCKEKVKSQKS